MDGGYRWWYVDALSDDGRYGLTLIAFVGSVFSPYYFKARARGATDPENYCSLNAILYGPGSKHWALTERGSGDLSRDASSMRVGPSALRFEGDRLVVDICEITVPWPRRLVGQVRVQLQQAQPRQFDLDPDARHHWWPFAPRARVEVEFDHPNLGWSGEAYADANWGEEPLEDGFSYWHWSRGVDPVGRTVVRYEAWPRRGDPALLSLGFTPGGVEELDAGESRKLPSTTIWRMRRDGRVQAGDTLAVQRTFEDTPFYSRSLLQTSGEGGDWLAMHESLDLDRFRRGWVQFLLPFRMPRFPRGPR